ncbi:MAG: hypothetical protein NT038_02795 [Euryarchaeota archaeon]|nr:hypothetical protein [Euryarchaeota archaeon]
MDTGMFVKVIEENAKNNERLANAIEGLTCEVKDIHEKYRDFSKKMLTIEIEIGFILVITVGILFKLILM